MRARLAAALVVLLLPSLIWIALDRSVWTWDPSWYGLVSLDLFDSWGSGAWIERMLGAFGTKAPAIAWLGQLFVPIGRLTGSVEVGLLLSILIEQAITLVLVFLTLQKLSRERAAPGWAAMLFCAAAPLFMALGHLYLTEAPQCLIVSCFVWLAATSHERNKIDLVCQCALFAALGLLAKVSTPLYCVGPGVICLARLAGAPLPSKLTRPKRAALIAVTLAVCGATLAWYAKNARALLDFVKASSSGTVAGHYGEARPLFTKLLLWLGQCELSFSFARIWVVLVLLFVAAIYWRIRRRKIDSLLDRIAAMSVFQILFCLIVFSLNVNEDPRYCLPLVLYFSLLVGWSVASLPSSLFAATALALALQWIAGVAVSVGVASFPGGLISILVPMERNGTGRQALRDVITATCKPSDKPINVMIGVDDLDLNSTNAQFYKSQRTDLRRSHCTYLHLGWAESDTSVAWERLQSIPGPLYFVSRDLERHGMTQDDFNRVSLSILQRVQAAREYERVDAPRLRAGGIALFRRK